MPYITADDRSRLLSDDEIPATPGELNYLITCLMISYIEKAGLSYTNINNAIGAAECAKLELYRRLAVPYENKKIAENGDVPFYAKHGSK